MKRWTFVAASVERKPLYSCVHADTILVSQVHICGYQECADMHVFTLSGHDDQVKILDRGVSKYILLISLYLTRR